MTTTPTLWKAPSQANTTDAANGAHAQAHSKIVGLTGGGFVVVWEDDTDRTQLGAPDVIGQRYDVEGVAVGGEFIASAIYQDAAQQAADLIAQPGGGFTVAYQTTDAAGFGDGENVDVDYFDAGGSADGNTDFRQGPGGQTIDDAAPSIVALDASSYALLYKQTEAAAASVVGYVVTNGVAGSQFTLGDATDASVGPDAAKLSNGDFAVVYEEENTGGQGGPTADIHVAIRSATGAPVTAFDVSATSLADAHQPVIAAIGADRFVVAWEVPDPDVGGPGQAAIEAKIYGNGGGFVTDVAFAGGAAMTEPTVTALADGGFVVGWTDGGDGAIHAQRYGSGGAAVGSEFTLSATGASDAQFALLGDGRIAVSYTATDLANDADVLFAIWDPRTGPINGGAAADVITSRQDGATVNGLGGSDILLGQGADDTLSGGGASDRLYGRAGADKLQGGGGSDAMVGGDGNDFYYVDDLGDSVREKTGEGHDTVSSSVDFSLAGQAVEDLVLTGAADVDGTGGSLANHIMGNDGMNALNGSSGDDTIAGGLGADTLTGGKGADVFVFDTAPSGAVDHIVDFSHVSEHLELDRDVFGALALGGLARAAFRDLSTGAEDQDDRILYDHATGALYYDADGAGGTAMIQFATLDNHAALDRGDLLVV